MNYRAMPRSPQPPPSSHDFTRRYSEPWRVGFTRATRRNPCPICGAKKYCQVTRDHRLAHCMKESVGAIKQARDGGYLHLLTHESLRIVSTAASSKHVNLTRPLRPEPTPAPLAPIEIRDAAYRKLIELSPAWNHECELVTAQPDGLLARGLTSEDVARFGAFPMSVAERDVLAEVINLSLAERFPADVAATHRSACIGVPGLWQHPRGRIKIGKDYDFKHPALIIPYRDSYGRIQACQLRFAGQRGYHWLSTSEDRLEEEPLGTPSGAPLHWTFIDDEKANADALPILVTEGALKAEVFVRLRSPMRAIATAGVGVAHTELIAATSGQEVIIAFDSDHRQNKNVCRQLAKLIAERAQDARATGNNVSTSVVVWEGAKGVDDAVLANLHLRVVGVAAWFQNLTKESAEEVSDVWQNYGFAPNAENSSHGNQGKEA